MTGLEAARGSQDGRFDTDRTAQKMRAQRGDFHNSVTRAPKALLWSLALLLAFVPACSRWGCSRVVIAELKHEDGPVSRDHAAKPGQWLPAPVGSEFSVGDGVRTGPKAAAAVLLDDGTMLLLEESTVVRFSPTPPNRRERGLDVQAGSVTIEAGGAELLLRTQMGLARIDPGSIVQVGSGKKGLRLFVRVGKARLEAAGKQTETLHAGQGIEIGVGLAVLERFGEEAASVPSGAPTAPVEAVAKPLVDFGQLVVKVEGPGTSLKAPGDKAWSRLDSGDVRVAPGSELRLASGANAEVQGGRQTARLGGPGQYAIGGSPDRFVSLVSGSTVLTADGTDVGLRVADGSVVARGSQTKSVAEVKLDHQRLVGIVARQGIVVVKIGGRQETLRAGEKVTIGAKGQVKVTGRGIGFFDVTVNAGGSLALHDPNPPTAVGFVFGSVCPARAMVELMRRGSVADAAVATGQANLRVPSGASLYRVRCLDESGVEGPVAAQGSVAVIHDAGTAPLAAGAPSTFVDTDGRAYTVLYQNRLPTVLVRWPHPPKASSYVLVHQSPSGTRSLTTAQPEYTFRSGAVVEGRHVLTFQTGSAQSRPATVVVRFDPAAPKASINSPSDGGFAPGASVTVSGSALPDWRVFVGDRELPVDDVRRFSGPATAGDRVLLIRFQHPRRGSDLYLRRASGVER
ncbi:MAG: FecR domain-containing protein [Polyangiaceae bacterium]|nr:FecR domain-containing protein [Polyangiaceae bacterium]